MGFGDAGARRVAKGGWSAAGGDEQAVDVTVVTAFDLDDEVAAGGSACKTDGAHGGFGAAVDQADLFEARDVLDELFGQPDFSFRGDAEARPAFEGLGHGLNDLRVSVAEDQGSPGQDVVDVFVAIGVGDAGAFAGCREKWLATDALERAHGTVYATDEYAIGLFEERLRPRPATWAMAVS